jgi:hypothetical protein
MRIMLAERTVLAPGYCRAYQKGRDETVQTPRAVYQQGYTPGEAIAEASGQFVEPDQESAQAPGFEGDQAAREAVRQMAPQTLDLPDPWRGYFQNALDALHDALAQ